MKKQPVPAMAAAAAPTYWACPVCGHLSADIALADPASLCPQCSSSGVERFTFPNERLRHLDVRIRRYHSEGESEIVVILGSTFLETLLEDILDRIMAAHGADVAVRSMVLDNVRAVGTRIGKLFPALTAEEFEEAAAKMGFRDFPKRWRHIRQVRNAFIHDTAYRDVQESLDAATASRTMELIDQAYSLFVAINNKFVVDGWHPPEKVRKKRTPGFEEQLG